MFYRDAFTLWLEQHTPHHRPKVYQPGAFFGAPPVGWELTLGRTKFVYRVPPEMSDVLYIVLIERVTARHALHSPFADLVRLLQLIQQSGTGIRRIRGHVEPSAKRSPDTLSRERLLAFYRRYLTAVGEGRDHGIEWFGGDLTAFSWTAEKSKIQHLAASEETPTKTA